MRVAENDGRGNSVRSGMASSGTSGQSGRTNLAACEATISECLSSNFENMWFLALT